MSGRQCEFIFRAVMFSLLSSKQLNCFFPTNQISEYQIQALIFVSCACIRGELQDKLPTRKQEHSQSAPLRAKVEADLIAPARVTFKWRVGAVPRETRLIKT